MPTITGTPGPDTLSGGDASDDVLLGGDGADSLNGGGGNDVLWGELGDDTLHGGAGDDTLYPSDLTARNDRQANLLRGEDGNDHLEAFGQYNDTLDGGAGDDTFQLKTYEERAIVAVGGGGNDAFTISGPIHAHVEGGTGDDRFEVVYLSATAALDIVTGPGRDMITVSMPIFHASFRVADFTAGASGDTFALATLLKAAVPAWSTTINPFSGGLARLVDSGGDVLLQVHVSGAWRDLARLGGLERTALTADNFGGYDPFAAPPPPIVGDTGRDILEAAGPATMSGGGGNDVLLGSYGRDYLRGDEGDDGLSGNGEFDDLNGNMGNDTVHGDAGDDWVVGGKDNDLLFGDDGNDIVYGNLGDDTCQAGDGNDLLRGGQGSDVLYGDQEQDWLSGDRGDDTVYGGSGADTFHSFSGADTDRLMDFSASQGDRLQLDPGTVYTLRQEGADTIVDMGLGQRVILVGVSLAGLPDGWILSG